MIAKVRTDRSRRWSSDVACRAVPGLNGLDRTLARPQEMLGCSENLLILDCLTCNKAQKTKQAKLKLKMESIF